MVQVERGRDARPEEQQAHEQGRARDPKQETTGQHQFARILYVSPSVYSTVTSCAILSSL